MHWTGRAATPLLAAAALAGCAGDPHPEALAPTDELAAGFANPPAEARPRTWWHWMNGNITRDGIAKDLAWMKSVGLGGVQTFDASLGTPQVVDERLVYMTPAWKDAFRFAAKEARSQGLEMTIASSPGWSETGGPWVKPEQAMKKLVWSETIVAAGKPFRGRLAPPPAITGPYQTAKLAVPMAFGPQPDLPKASGPVAVLAVPLPAAVLPKPRMSLADGTPLAIAPLEDADLNTGISIPVDEARSGAFLVSYPRPVTVRSLDLFMPGLKSPFRGVPIALALEARVGGAWRKIADVPVDAVPTVTAFAPVTARDFRMVISPAPAAHFAELDGAPGAIVTDVFATGPLTKVELTDFALSNEEQVDHAAQKAGYATVPDYFALAAPAAGVKAPPLAAVIDLTDRVMPDGSLEWTPPGSGRWRILNFGWSLTGTTNHPAPPEATGLEVDKMDGDAVQSYLDHYLATYRDAAGGLDKIDGLLTDSIEAGAATWTPEMEREFAARRGYPLRPWLPALTGMVIGSADETDRFLYDWRRTLGELLAEKHYGTIAQVAHENGLIVYGEALEDGRPLLGNDLAIRRYTDVPMAAMWTWPKAAAPRSTLVGDIRGAASVAHVWGKRFVAAESLTSASSPWAFAPRDLKRVIDLEFLLGVNRPVIHTSVHQPLDDKQPGLSLAVFGQYFNRHETWAGMARPWIEYIARTGFLLQQGHYAADIAWFMGEEAPLTAQFADGPPKGLPTRYGYDFVDADMLRDGLTIANGELKGKGGTRYRLLYLGEQSRRMTLATLRRVAEVADAGVPVSGVRPEGSPSLADDKADFAALVERVWALPNVTSGDAEAALAGRGVVPDFEWRGSADSDVRFVHRILDDGDAYYVVNRRDREESGEAILRVTGKTPVWWDPVTGEHRPLSYRREGGRTSVALDLPAQAAGFVVLREPARAREAAYAPASEVPVEASFTPWTVSFQPGRGAPSQALTMHSLIPLETSQDPGIKYFSGVATYRAAVTFGAIPRGRVWLNLGKVGDVAQVFVNGSDAGIVWFEPNRVNVSGLVHKGTNQIEVRVANLWVNRLIGDAQPGASKIAFVTAPTYRPDAPLRASGLIGPVSLTAER